VNEWRVIASLTRPSTVATMSRTPGVFPVIETGRF
jgi:hypothetical protein